MTFNPGDDIHAANSSRSRSIGPPIFPALMAMATSLLPVGMGRSYGDVCLNHGNTCC